MKENIDKKEDLKSYNSFCEYYAASRKTAREKIISSEIKIIPRGVTEEEVKVMSKIPYCRKELERQFKVGTGQLAPAHETD